MFAIRCNGYDWGVFSSVTSARVAARVHWGTDWDRIVEGRAIRCVVKLDRVTLHGQCLDSGRLPYEMSRD